MRKSRDCLCRTAAALLVAACAVPPAADPSPTKVIDKKVAKDIANAFIDLGMTPERARCYGATVAAELGAEDRQTAVRLVHQADSAADVKTRVIGAGPAFVGAFSAANARCPEGMGN